MLVSVADMHRTPPPTGHADRSAGRQARRLSVTCRVTHTADEDPFIINVTYPCSSAQFDHADFPFDSIVVERCVRVRREPQVVLDPGFDPAWWFSEEGSGQHADRFGKAASGEGIGVCDQEDPVAPAGKLVAGLQVSE